MGSGATLGLVHDYLLVLRGAERTFGQIAAIWPQAPVATLVYDETVIATEFAGHPIRASRLQNLGLTQDGFRRFLPLFSSAAQRLADPDWDLVVSSSSAFAHGVRPGPGAVHVCYCHSPFRYAWHEERTAMAEMPAALRPALGALLARHRRFDRIALSSITALISNSQLTQARIREFWGRDSRVIHPPVNVERFWCGEAEDYFLVVGEITRHKRHGLALSAAEKVGARIKVVGAGPMLPALREAHPRAEFVGRLGDEQVADLYARAKAVIVPNQEDFGIVAVEAQAAGRPVLAASGGGATETVIGGQTGEFFAPDDLDGLAALMRGDFDRFDHTAIRAHAQQFSAANFRANMRDAVAEACARAGRSDLAVYAATSAAPDMVKVGG